jgi:hypothetical protein
LNIFLNFVLGFELRALYFLGKSSTTWAMPPTLFALVNFWVGSWVFAQGAGFEPQFSYLFLFHSWDHRWEPPCPSSLVIWGLTNILSRLALNYYLPNLCLPSSWDYRWATMLGSCSLLLKTLFLTNVLKHSET